MKQVTDRRRSLSRCWVLIAAGFFTIILGVGCQCLLAPDEREASAAKALTRRVFDCTRVEISGVGDKGSYRTFMVWKLPSGPGTYTVVDVEKRTGRILRWEYGK